MAILDGGSVKGFELIQYGRPYTKFDVNSAAESTNLNGDFLDDQNGFFVGASGVVVTITTNNVYVRQASGWTNVQEIYVNVSGTWKRVSNDKFYVKTAGGPWRS